MTNKLADEFDLDKEIIEIESFKEILDNIKEIPNPSKIVAATIEKASIFIDLIHTECVNGELSPRYAEVISQLLNTIIQSSNFLTNETQTEFENKLKYISSQQKDREIDIKDREVSIKEIFYNTKKLDSDKNNVIITDSNSIIKFLTNKKEDECQ